MKFFDRKYLLQIGDSETGDGLTIDNLQMQFKVRKSVNNEKKVDQCSVTIYNLSNESLAYLETDFPVAVFSCGYKDNLVRLFYGEVIDFQTKKQGTDRITKIDITPSFTELTHQLISQVIPEDGLVEDIFEVIRKQAKLSKGVYRGESLGKKIIYGYPMAGTPRQMLDQACQQFDLEWKIEGEALYINDSKSVQSTLIETAPVISPSTGLIDRPYPYTGKDKRSEEDDKKVKGVKFTALINPNVLPGTLVRVDYNNESNYYRVEEVEFSGDFRGANWYMECICSIRPEV